MPLLWSEPVSASSGKGEASHGLYVRWFWEIGRTCTEWSDWVCWRWSWCTSHVNNNRAVWAEEMAVQSSCSGGHTCIETMLWGSWSTVQWPTASCVGVDPDWDWKHIQRRQVRSLQERMARRQSFSAGCIQPLLSEVSAISWGHSAPRTTHPGRVR